MEKNKSIANNMTTGNPAKLIFLFSVPLLLGNVLQQLYNMVDSMVVGNYVGKTALAAVGTGFPIIFMVVSFFMGIGIGTTILISQYYGAGKLDDVTKVIKTIYTGIFVSVVPVSVIGILISKPILTLINVPPDTLPQANLYMMIIFGGMIGTFGYNINAGILQGLGDSKTSLVFLAISTVINIVLDLVFVIYFHMGVAGVALATVVAQVVSWIIGIRYISKKYDFFQFNIREFYFDKQLFIIIFKLGIPSGIQNAIFSVGIMSLQSLINGYGSDFMAGFNAANKIDTFAWMPIQSFASAITTYVGQNIGAGRMDRVRSGVIATVVMSAVTCIAIVLIVLPFGPQLLGLFNKEPAVIDAGMAYLSRILPPLFILAISFVLNGTMRGAGETVVPMVSSICALWLARIPSAYLIAHYFGRDNIFYSYAIGWILGIIITGTYYFTGRWKNKSEKLIKQNLN